MAFTNPKDILSIFYFLRFIFSPVKGIEARVSPVKYMCFTSDPCYIPSLRFLKTICISITPYSVLNYHLSKCLLFKNK